jgi:hypothetical protein
MLNLSWLTSSYFKIKHILKTHFKEDGLFLMGKDMERRRRRIGTTLSSSLIQFKFIFHSISLSFISLSFSLFFFLSLDF